MQNTKKTALELIAENNTEVYVYEQEFQELASDNLAIEKLLTEYQTRVAQLYEEFWRKVNDLPAETKEVINQKLDKSIETRVLRINEDDTDFMQMLVSLPEKEKELIMEDFNNPEISKESILTNMDCGLYAVRAQMRETTARWEESKERRWALINKANQCKNTVEA